LRDTTAGVCLVRQPVCSDSSGDGSQLLKAVLVNGGLSVSARSCSSVFPFCLRFFLCAFFVVGEFTVSLGSTEGSKGTEDSLDKVR